MCLLPTRICHPPPDWVGSGSWELAVPGWSSELQGPPGASDTVIRLGPAAGLEHDLPLHKARWWEAAQVARWTQHEHPRISEAYDTMLAKQGSNAQRNCVVIMELKLVQVSCVQVAS